MLCGQRPVAPSCESVYVVVVVVELRRIGDEFCMTQQTLASRPTLGLLVNIAIAFCLVQDSLADAKVTARQQCVYEGP